MYFDLSTENKELIMIIIMIIIVIIITIIIMTVIMMMIIIIIIIIIIINKETGSLRCIYANELDKAWDGLRRF